jgi:hypothetical protein
MRETVSTAQHHSPNPEGGGVSWVAATPKKTSSSWQQLGLTPERWAEITAACSVRVVAMAMETQETDQSSCSSLNSPLT